MEELSEEVLAEAVQEEKKAQVDSPEEAPSIETQAPVTEEVVDIVKEEPVEIVKDNNDNN